MKKLLLLLLIAPVLGFSQEIISEEVLNTIEIDSTKFELVSFGLYEYKGKKQKRKEKKFIYIIASTHKKNLEKDFKKLTYLTMFEDNTILKFSSKKEIKRLKSLIKLVKKNKDISLNDVYFHIGDYFSDYIDDTTINILYNIESDYNFYLTTSDTRYSYASEQSLKLPFDIKQSIKYGDQFEYVDYKIDYFNNPFSIKTNLEGMERFIKFLENK